MITPEPQAPAVTLPKVWTALDVGMILASVLFLWLLLGGLLLLGFDVDLAAEGDISDLTLNLLLLVINVATMMLPVYLVGWWRGVHWRDVGLRAMSLAWWGRSIGLGVAAIFIANLVAQAVIFLQGKRLENPQIDFVLPAGFSWLGLVGMTVLVGMLVPVAEELVFRGVIFRWLRQHYSFGWAAAISSMIFGLFHIIPAVAVAAAVLGFLAAWVYERSGSLWAAVIVHAINNAVQVALLYLTLL